MTLAIRTDHTMLGRLLDSYTDVGVDCGLDLAEIARGRHLLRHAWITTCGTRPARDYCRLIGVILESGGAS